MPFTYDYPRMLVTVDALILLRDSSNDLKVLLIKRKNNPYKNAYALPGGFPEMSELLSDAAARELLEETGLQNIELKQLATFDAIGRDPRDRNICTAFYGFTTPANSKLTAGDDAAEADWFPLKSLPQLAFDHKAIIEFALMELGVDL